MLSTIINGCKDSLDGPFCVLCKNGSGFYYNRDINACEECGPRTTYVTVILDQIASCKSASPRD